MGKSMRDPVQRGPELRAGPAKPDPRTCPECGIKLSSYNPGPNCWSHTVGWPWRGPSAKPKF